MIDKTGGRRRRQRRKIRSSQRSLTHSLVRGQRLLGTCGVGEPGMASTVTDPPPANNEFRADTAPLRWMQLKSGAGRIYRHSSGHVLKSQAPGHEFPEGKVEPECQKTKIGGVADSVGPFPSSAPDKHQSCTRAERARSILRRLGGWKSCKIKFKRRQDA